MTFVSSVMIIVFTLPILLGFEQKVSLLAPLNNIVHISYFSFFIMPLGLLCLVLSLFSLGLPPGWLEASAYELFSRLAQVWIKLVDLNFEIAGPLSIPPLGSFPLTANIAYYLMLGAFIIWRIKKIQTN